VTADSDVGSDAQLARELLEGAAGGFERFVDTYHARLFQYAYSMCGHREDAEEVAQETLMKVFESLDQLREPERLKAWVFRIAKNACLMKRRKSVFAPPAELSLDEMRPSKDGATAHIEIADWSALPEDLASHAELRRALGRAVQALPDLYRMVFLLRDVEGLTTPEAADVLGLSEDTVKQRLHRARLALRKSLDEYAQERFKERRPV
jgi:RNA polymerase sigma-70 factor (ECF subfamily)